METKENLPERRKALEKASFTLQLRDHVRSLYPQYKKERENLHHDLLPLLDEVYPELVKTLNVQKEFGGMPVDWSASLLFDYYLKKREPLPQHCNYGFILNEFLPSVCNPLEKAANFALNIYNFLREKRENNFSCTPTKWGMVDNTVYEKFIHLTRRPGKEKDSIVYNSWNDIQAMIVTYKGNYFKVPLVSPKNQVYSAKEITKALDEIVHYKKGQNPFPVGMLTSLNRDKWAEYRESLLQVEGFSPFLEEVEKSLFVLALDFSSPQSEMVREAIDRNANNHWYDKSLMISVAPNGILSVNCDHLIMDGSPFLDMINSAFEAGEGSTLETKEKLFVKDLNYSKIDKIIPKELQILIQNELREEQEAISCSHKNIDIGTDFFKGLKLRPDMSFQLFIQMASLMTFESVLCTSQAVEMRTFEYGRYDTVISNSKYIHKLLNLFDMANESAGPFMTLFKDLIEKQKNKIVCCKKGETFFTYLQALLAWELPTDNPKYLKLNLLKSLFQNHPMLCGMLDPDISTSGIPEMKSINKFVFTDFGKHKLGLGYIIGSKNITLGIYGLGKYRDREDQFIKNLNYIINKFVSIYGDSNDKAG
ncbi:MAG: choline/carnitine O-acyltransferase [Bdellovibrionota bacterium]|nr:choline/carnitine O-acyltransferase [Bdellovibrionota bacterium]|tara:strand:+ start:1024 stop:2802 length:1779 start_codon:yes stop_codon:yes gene_type:complete